jgi:hypothetical protein
MAVRSFSTTSSGDLRAAASGRPRPPKTRRRESASKHLCPASASRFARRVLETCTKTRTGRFRWLVGSSTRPVRRRGAEKVRPAISRCLKAFSELFSSYPSTPAVPCAGCRPFGPVGARPSGTNQPAENRAQRAGRWIKTQHFGPDVVVLALVPNEKLDQLTT